MKLPRVNPIVVKELRQGLKSKSFLVCFLGLQALMVFCMAVYFQNVNSTGGLQGADGFFWTLIGMALLFFMPLRALFCIYNELKGNTLELLFLTHMRSTQIAGGKWMAQAIQGGMLICSILPYFVLRYLLGRINIVRDFQTLGVLLLVSLVMLAAGTGISAWKSRMLRFAVIGGAIFSLMTLPGLLISMALGGLGGSPFGGFSWNLLTSLLLTGILILYFLEHGAALIAPPAENHARPKRILALCLHLILLGTGLYERSMVWMILSIVVLFPQYLEFLAEPVSDIASLYKKPRRLAFLRWLLLPGWVSALLPVTLLLAASVVFLQSEAPLKTEVAHLFPILFGFLFFPVVPLELFKVSKARWRAAYLGVQVLTIVIGSILMSASEIQSRMPGGRPMDTLLGYIPFTAFFQLGEAHSMNLHASWTPAILTAILLLILLPRPLRQMRALSRQANSSTSAHDE